MNEVKWNSFSHVQLFATPWSVACHAPLSMRFSRQKYWSGLPFPSAGVLPNPETESRSPSLQADSLPSEPPGKPDVIRKWTWKWLSHVWLFVTPWTIAHQSPPSKEFSSQEYWSGFPFPSTGDLPNPGIEPRSPALQAEFYFYQLSYKGRPVLK